MEIDKIKVKKIIEQQVKPNENIIVWTDAYVKGALDTYNEQVIHHNVDPDLAKQRIINYVTQRLESELK